jgi:hypothetical protein
MSKKFETKKQALDAGMVAGKERRIETHEPYEIRIVDVSGYPWFGYEFAVMVKPSAATLHPFSGVRIPECPQTRFATTVDVWLEKDRNAGGGVGAVSPMFEGETFATGVQAARDWISRYA